MVEQVDRVGLCRSCRLGDRVPSSRGGEFWRCRKSEVDPDFLKYPRLPVVECRGYEEK
ncbi:MAG TPA: hypothetical protein VHZ73_12700 [Vicinamibacterales bacterium]|jgi:hypothetical protein|nr:hypothetical protein [Vicinamibacterales bacterium]